MKVKECSRIVFAFCILAIYGLDLAAQDGPIWPISGRVIVQDSSDPIFRARIQVLDPDSGELLMPVAFTDEQGNYATGIATSLVDDDYRDVADRYEIQSLYPNPVQPSSSQTINIRYTVPGDAGEIPALEIYDLLGRRVQPGVRLASGVYFFRLRFQEGRASTPVKSVVLLDSGPLNVLLNQLTATRGLPVVQNNQSNTGNQSSNQAKPGSGGTATISNGISVRVVVSRDGYISSDELITLNEQSNQYDVNLSPAGMPVASFTFGGELQAGSLVSFDATESEGGEHSGLVAYSWDFGNGRRGGGRKVSHVFSEEGTYSVQLTVRGGYGETATISREIAVVAAEPPLSDDGVIRGLVLGTDGYPKTGAVVRISGTGLEIATDVIGRIRMDNLPTGVPLNLEITLPGFASQRLPVTIPVAGMEAYFEVTLLERGSSQTLSTAELGGAAGGDHGARIELPVEGLLRGDGSAVTGDVNVTMTPVDVSDRDQIGGFPGEFAGITPDGVAEIILSYGASEYVIEQEGETLQLAAGKAATIEIPLFISTYEDGRSVMPGDVLPLWSLDETTGKWVLEGDGIVVESAGSPTGLAMRAMVTHFSWWNIDVAPDPYRPRPLPVQPPCEIPPQDFCANNSNVTLCVKSIQLLCESLDPDYPWPDEDRDPEEEPDPDTLCDDNPEACENVCGQLNGLCTPVHLEGEQREEDGPRGIPRNTPLPPGGAPVFLPPNQTIILTATGANGTVRGSRTVNGASGSGGFVVIPMGPVATAGAGPIACRELKTAVVNTVNTLQTWTFEALSGDIRDFSVKPATGSILQGQVTVRAPSGAVISQGTFSSFTPFEILRELTENGTYAILIEGTANAPGAYSIGLNCVQKILYDTETRSEMIAGLDNVYAFDAKTADRVKMAVLTDNFTGNVNLQLQNPQRVIQQQTGYTQNYGEAAYYTVPQDGMYIIRALSSNNGAGEYILGLNMLKEPEEIQLQSPVASVSGAISNLGERRYYRFTGNQWDVRNFVLNHALNSELQASIHLLGPGQQPFYQRQLLRAAGTSQNQRIAELTPDLLPQTGEYIIEIFGNSGNTRQSRTGQFGITMHIPQMQTMTAESETQLVMTERGFNLIEFDGVTGEHLILAGLTQTFNGMLNMRIFSPQGGLVTQTGFFTTYGEAGIFTLNQNGKYLIVSDGNTDAQGTYTLGLTRPGMPEDVQLAGPVTTINGEITLLGQRKYYRFAGIRGDVRNFLLQHPQISLLRAAMTIRQPGAAPYFNRTAWKTEQTNMNLRLRESTPDLIPVDGEYIIEVKGADGTLRTQRTGAYELAMHIPQIQEMTKNANINLSNDPYQFHVVEFDASAGDHVNAAAQLSNYTGSLRLRIISPAGVEIKNGFISSYGETDVVILNQSGRFKIIADGQNDASGSYMMGLSQWPAEDEIVTLLLDRPVSTIGGSLDVIGDRRFYRMAGSSDDVMNFILRHDPGSLLNAGFTLRRPGIQQYFNRSAEVFVTTATGTRERESTPDFLSENGTYVIEVKANSSAVLSQVTGSFEFDINYPEPVQVSWNSENNAVLPARGFNIFHLSAQEGDYLNLAVLSEQLSGSMQMWIHNPAKTRVNTSNALAYGESGVIRLAETGTYTIINRSLSAAEGPYLMGIARIEEPELMVLQSPSVMVNNEIGLLGAKKFYRFEGTINDVRNFILSHPGSSLLNATMYIRQPGTQPFYSRAFVTGASTNNTTRTVNRNLTLTSSGEYIIEVWGSAGTTYLQRTGGFNVTVESN